MEPRELHIGDACPNCGADFKEIPAPSSEQRAAASRPDDPMPLPPYVDTAPEHVRDDLGALYRCSNCPYKARLRAPDADGATDGEQTPRNKRRR